MRKLLLSAVVVLGLATTANAQDLTNAVTCPAVQTITCTDTPLNPIPGKKYDYTVTVNPVGGSFNWFVTTDPNFMAGGVLTTNIETVAGSIILATGTGYNDIATGAATQEITWQAAPTTGDLFLVMHYTDATSCTSDNLKVYKIEMKNNFSIDVYNVTAAGGANTTLGTATTPTICPPKVKGASYDSPSQTMVYDYNTTYAYYVVSAANFVDSWDLKFKVNANLNTAPVNSAQVMTVSWSNDGTGSWTNLTAVSSVYSANVAGTPGFNATDCIVVRVAIENNEFESPVNQVVELSADATYGPTATAIKDVKTDCTEATPFQKTGTQTITPRPSVVSTTLGTGVDFIPKY